jgi:peptidoglycan/xylan/chitin deacetylase (PgdA/CDA1 family)
MERMRLLTLSFDDGFAKSFRLIADIHEEFGLKANLNVIAGTGLPGYSAADRYHNAPVGGWDLWNELAERGHDVSAHSLDHANYARLPLDEAKRRIDRCADIFEAKLKGYRASENVFAFPFNSSNRDVEDLVLTRFRGLRTSGPGINPLPLPSLRRLTCSSFGPGNCEEHLDRCIDELEKRELGWLIYNTHGFDEEGWGPISPAYLRKLYARLARADSGIKVVTLGPVLAQAL